MKKQYRLLYLAFFLSGVAAILYEVMWVRLLALAFGGVTLVVAVVTGLFLGGLAGGAALGGRIADRVDERRGVRGLGWWYLGIEVLIGGLGLVAWQVFMGFGMTGGDWRWGVAAGLLLLQSGLAGATWPTMYKLLLRLGWQWKVAGLITFINTLGGAVGALVAAFLLVGNVGVGGAVLAAVVGNILAGLLVGGVVVKGEEFGREGIVIKQVKKVQGKFDWQGHWRLMLILGLAGFWGMAMEILWVRAFGLVLGTSVYAFALVLGVILFGLALGGIVVEKWKGSLSFSGLITIIWWWAVFVGLGIVMLPQLPEMVAGVLKASGLSFWAIQVWSLGVVALVGLVPSLLSGMILPWSVVMIKSSLREAGGEAGWAYFVNTLGATMGGMAAALWLLPNLGLQWGMIILAGLAGFVALVYRLIDKVGWSRLAMSTLVVGGILVWGWLGWDKHKLASAAYLYGKQMFDPGLNLVYYKDGREATITATQRKGATSLRINGKADASSGSDMGTQILSGFLPVIFHPEPKRMMVLGLGSGVTAAVSAQEEAVEELVVIEIEEAVVEVAREYFSKENLEVLDNPKVELVLQDGRNYLLESEKEFDVISSEPSNPWTAGGATLFTQEFFELGKRRLASGGVFFQWLQLYSLRPEEMKVVWATFKSVFPHVQIWLSTLSGDSFLVGSNEPLELEWEQLVRVVDDEVMGQYLKWAEVEDEVGLLSLFVTGDEGVERLAVGGEIHTDARPILEYRLPWGLLTETRAANYELLRGLWGEVDFVKGMPDEARQQLAKTREARLLLMEADEWFKQGEIEKAKRLADQALELDEKTPALSRALARIDYQLGVIYQSVRAGKEKEKDEELAEAVLKLWREAVELKPDYFDPYPRLAEAYLGLKDWEKLEELLSQGREQFPWSGEMLMYEGIMAAEGEDQDKAEKLMLAAVVLEQSNYVIHNNLAHLYSLTNKLELALKEWKISLRLNPDQPQINRAVKNAEKLIRMQE